MPVDYEVAKITYMFLRKLTPTGFLFSPIDAEFERRPGRQSERRRRCWSSEGPRMIVAAPCASGNRVDVYERALETARK